MYYPCSTKCFVAFDQSLITQFAVGVTVRVGQIIA